MAQEQRYAVVDADGKVANIILWDGEAKWSPGPGFTVRLATSDDRIPEPEQPVE